MDVVKDVDPKPSPNRPVSVAALIGIATSILSPSGLNFDLDRLYLVKYGDTSQSQYKYYVLEGAHRIATVRSLLTGMGLTKELHDEFNSEKHNALRENLKQRFRVNVLAQADIPKGSEILLGAYLNKQKAKVVKESFVDTLYMYDRLITRSDELFARSPVSAIPQKDLFGKDSVVVEDRKTTKTHLEVYASLRLKKVDDRMADLAQREPLSLRLCPVRGARSRGFLCRFLVGSSF